MIEEVPHTTDDSNETNSGAVKFTFDEDVRSGSRIKVIGIGGGGGNAVNHMVKEGITGVEFVAINTDEQVLQISRASVKLQLGPKLTQGHGAGSDCEIGRNAALEDTERLLELLSDTDIVFVTAGLGGGTGTGAAPVIASLAKEMGALTVAVVTKPFLFEGVRRMQTALQGLDELIETVDTIVTIPNEYLLKQMKPGTSFFEAFRMIDDILLQAVKGISDLITIPGIINHDFADLRTIMQGMGYAVIGMATRKGKNAVVEAARAAISCPLIEDSNIDGALGTLINVTGSSKLALHEVHEAATIIQKAVDTNAHILFGLVLDKSMGEDVRVTVIATGFGDRWKGGNQSQSIMRNTLAPGASMPTAGGGFITDPASETADLLPAADSEQTDLSADDFTLGEDAETVSAVEPEQTEIPMEKPFETEDIDRPAFFRRHFGD